MNKPYNAKIHLLTLKEQSIGIQDMLFKYRYNYYYYINKKLLNCSISSIVKEGTNRIDQQKQSCDSIFCPICASTHKIRRECAIAYGVIDKINEGIELDNGKKTSPILRYLTLTIQKEYIYLFEETFEQLKSNFKLFLKTPMQKKSGKYVTIAESLLGCSIYYHLALDDDYAGNPVVGIHLHAILLLKPSFAGVNSITQQMICDYWMIVTGQHVLLETKIQTLPSTPHDFKNNHAYNLAKFDFNSIIANPSKFVALIPYLQGQHFHTHTGLIRKYRKEVREEHKTRRKDDLVKRLNELDMETDSSM